MARPRPSKSSPRSGTNKPSGSASGRRRAGASTEAKPSRGTSPRAASKPKGKPASSARRKGKEQPFAPNEREQREGVRLQKFMASAGVSSRRKAEELIVAGAVSVNGQVVTELGARVFPGRDRVTVHGEPIAAEAKVYFVLNKPDQIVSSAAGSVDERGRPTVLSLLHGISERLYPVGRLDYHSRGVILLTNDGELAAKLTHPRHGVIKTYHAKFQGKLSADDEQALRDGVELDDGTVTRPLAELFAFRETDTNVWYQVGLTEGLNRQLRRMGEAIGHPVLKLIRVAIGDITADGLAEGEFRPLTSTEVGQLLESVQLDPTRKSAEPRRAPKPPAKPRPLAAKPRSEGAERRAGGSKPPTRAKKTFAKKPAAKKPAAKKSGSSSAQRSRPAQRKRGPNK